MRAARDALRKLGYHAREQLAFRRVDVQLEVAVVCGHFEQRVDIRAHRLGRALRTDLAHPAGNRDGQLNEARLGLREQAVPLAFVLGQTGGQRVLQPGQLGLRGLQHRLPRFVPDLFQALLPALRQTLLIARSAARFRHLPSPDLGLGQKSVGGCPGPRENVAALALHVREREPGGTGFRPVGRSELFSSNHSAHTPIRWVAPASSRRQVLWSA